MSKFSVVEYEDESGVWAPVMTRDDARVKLLRQEAKYPDRNFRLALYERPEDDAPADEDAPAWRQTWPMFERAMLRGAELDAREHGDVVPNETPPGNIGEIREDLVGLAIKIFRAWLGLGYVQREKAE